MPEDRPLTIIHVLRAPMGGVLRHVRDLALAHTAQGCDVGIICDVPGNPGYNETVLEALNTQLAHGVVRVSMGRGVGPRDLVAARQVDQHIDKIAPDIIHGHGAKGGLYGRISKGGSRGPARFYSPHGGSLHFDADSLAGKVYFTVEKMLEGKTDAMLFVADYERRTYRRKIGDLACPSVIIYNGLDDDEFTPVTPDKDAADFLFIGELRLLKGPDLVIDALQQINKGRKKPASLIMVGAGVDSAALAKRSADAGLSPFVTFLPPMPAREAFAKARTIVIPSRAEAMPYIVLEALAAKRPVITTGVGGIPEIFGSAASALVKPEIDSVAAAMQQALENPDAFATRMPAAGMLRERFTKSVMAKHVLEAYRAARR